MCASVCVCIVVVKGFRAFDQNYRCRRCLICSHITYNYCYVGLRVTTAWLLVCACAAHIVVRDIHMLPAVRRCITVNCNIFCYCIFVRYSTRCSQIDINQSACKIWFVGLLLVKINIFFCVNCGQHALTCHRLHFGKQFYSADSFII